MISTEMVLLNRQALSFHDDIHAVDIARCQVEDQCFDACTDLALIGPYCIINAQAEHL
jgi:hypothetical protein